MINFLLFSSMTQRHSNTALCTWTVCLKFQIWKSLKVLPNSSWTQDKLFPYSVQSSQHYVIAQPLCAWGHVSHGACQPAFRNIIRGKGAYWYFILKYTRPLYFFSFLALSTKPENFLCWEKKKPFGVLGLSLFLVIFTSKKFVIYFQRHITINKNNYPLRKTRMGAHLFMALCLDFPLAARWLLFSCPSLEVNIQGISPLLSYYLLQLCRKQVKINCFSLQSKRSWVKSQLRNMLLRISLLR